ncbi:hypothetical protein EJB05_05502, partial [Eragrostis curvula]
MFVSLTPQLPPHVPIPRSPFPPPNRLSTASREPPAPPSPSPAASILDPRLSPLRKRGARIAFGHLVALSGRLQVRGEMARRSRKKKRRNPAANLTDDIIVEILSRLPVKSICRFKCVSPHWSALISHPDHRRKLPQTLAGLFHCSYDCTRIPKGSFGYLGLHPNGDQILTGIE